MSRHSMVVSFACFAVVAWVAVAGPLAAQKAGPALTGTVTAGPETLEGVLVSAKKSGSTITTTVVSDKDGRYSFPAGRLEPGQYTLRIRAVGYELDRSDPVAISADKTAAADLALHKTDNIAPQLTNAEWLASMPGTDAQKGQLLNCVGCHTLARPLNSNYNADDFISFPATRKHDSKNQSIA